jgi:hypothetical protein
MIIFCITCKGRAQHIELTLPKNLADNRDYEAVKFVILDYNSPDHLVSFLKTNHKKDMDSGRVALYRYTEPGPFKMAHAKNMAHRLGIREGADILVNLDADNYTGPGFAGYIATRFQEARERKESPFLYARWNQEVRLPKGASGRIVVTPQDFLKVGGYDEKYATWGPDDKDFSARLCRLGCTPVEIDRRYLEVVLHNNRMRFRDYREAQANIFAYTAPINPTGTIANYGKFGMGTVFKGLSYEPIVLGPVPTRVFGIGMHKTATTALNAALKLLGFSSAHWESAWWAKIVWREMTALGASLTLERHYALSDFPISILYKQLDSAYPGSKFILTLRDEGKWLQSVRNHWNGGLNPFRKNWGTDPFTHKMHRLVYGQKGFNETVFLERYRRHNAEVLDYFKDRPGDLLIMDMDKGAGWVELCGFLERPIPNGPYPKRFVTGDKVTNYQI